MVVIPHIIMERAMTKEQLQALREQAKATVSTKVAAIRDAAEIKRLNSMISGPLGETMAKQQVVAETSTLLSAMIEECSGIVASMPIYSKATREQRKFNMTKVYGFGNQLSNLLGLLSGIQYSATDHKQLLLAHTGLSEDLIEQTLEAFGRPAYYSTNHSIIIDEQPYDSAKALECIQMIEAELNIILDKSKLTETTFRTQFELARINAETKAAATQLAVMKTIDVGA